MRNYRGFSQNLLLYITTSSSSNVSYTIQNYTGVITTGTVTNINPAKVSLPVSLVTLDSDYSNRKKGIYIYSAEPISVLVVNHQLRTVGEYMAYPFQEYPINQYQYYAVSTGTLAIFDNALSEVLVVGNEDNTTVTIIPTQAITVPQDIQSSTSPNITITTGSPFTFTLHRMQTFLFGAPIADITGTSIISDKPLTVISGHECGNVPDNVAACEHITEQIPPTVTWGKQFLLTPYANRSRQYYRIIASESESTLTYRCSSDSPVTLYLSNPGDFTTFFSNTSYCSLVSDKPVLVIQLGPGHVFGDIGDPVMSIVPSINQYSESVTFTSPTMSTHVLNIASTSKDTVLMDGQPLSLTWNNIYDSDNNIMGYGAQIQITKFTSHTITTKSNTKFSILVYSFDYATGYSYSAGVRQTQLVQSEHSGEVQLYMYHCKNCSII